MSDMETLDHHSSSRWFPIEKNWWIRQGVRRCVGPGSLLHWSSLFISLYKYAALDSFIGVND